MKVAIDNTGMNGRELGLSTHTYPCRFISYSDLSEEGQVVLLGISSVTQGSASWFQNGEPMKDQE